MASRDEFRTFSFDEFRLDAARGVVLGADGTELRLRPKTFALLRHMLDHPGQLLGREELLEALWPRMVVTDDSLTQCVGELRHAFGGRASQILRTVPRRGYMLTAAVRRDGPSRPDADPGSGPAPEAAILPSRDIAAFRQDPVAVHRFEAPDGDTTSGRLADTLASDLIAELTRVEGLRVLPAMEALATEGYRVQGEVRSVGEALRVTVRLEEAATGTVLWAERLDQPREGASGLSAATLSNLSTHLDRQVERHSHSAACRKPVAALTARELCLIGREHHQRITQADSEVAREMFARAIAADPDYAPAYAWQAYTVHRAITHGWGSPTGQAARDEALRLARRAVQLQPDSPLCLARLAFALVLDQRWEEAVAVARSALCTGRPAFAPSRITVCEVLVAAGHPEEAAEVAQDAIARDPLCPPTARGILGRALLLAGRVEEALPPLRWCALHLPDYAATYDTLVVAWDETGRMPEAREARRDLLRLRPDWVPQNHTGFWYFRRAEDLERFQAAHHRVAERDGDASMPAAAPAADLPGTDRVAPSPGASGRSGPMLGRPQIAGLAGLRQDTLVVQPLRPAPADATAAQAAAALAPNLMAELVRHADLRVVAGPDARVSQGFEVTGDVHTAGDSLRVHLRLDDLATGTTFWAGRMEWPSNQAAGLPVAEIASLATAMNVQIGRKSLRRARQKPAERLSARELTLLGREHYFRSTEVETSVARGLFLRASEADPGYAPALAWTAISLARTAIHGWHGEDRGRSLEQSIRLARIAVELDPESPHALASLCLTLALQGYWEEAVTTARLALRTNRIADDAARIASGDVLAAAGHPQEAEGAFRQALAQDPHGSPVLHGVLGRALLLDGRPEEAMAALRHCAVHLPDYALCFRTMVVAAVEAGLVEEARKALREVARLRPDWVTGAAPIFWFLRRPEDTERYEKAFRIASRLGAAADAGGLMQAPASRA
jgi:DNA-binding winged helix-turn-helix (wHTH) protein/tetratricopeptide (TPR) repeat protein